jgi:hypothetical protein
VHDGLVGAGFGLRILIDPGFSISRFRVTVGVEESMFGDSAQA